MGLFTTHIATVSHRISKEATLKTVAEYIKTVQELYTHQGEWFHTFSEQTPEDVRRNMLEF